MDHCDVSFIHLLSFDRFELSISVSGVYVIIAYFVLQETRGRDTEYFDHPISYLSTVGVILLQRARRLRKQTGDMRYKAKSEDQKQKLWKLIYISCTRPICELILIFPKYGQELTSVQCFFSPNPLLLRLV